MRTTGNMAGVSFIDAPAHLHCNTRELWRNIITESGYWFTKDAMRFFNTRIIWDSLICLDNDPVTFAFITSEQCSMPYHTPEPRMFTVRAWTEENGITNASEFQQFDTLAKARKHLMKGGAWGYLTAVNK